MPFKGSRKIDSCSEGGNHRWAIHSSGQYIKVSKCKKCGQKKWRAHRGRTNHTEIMKEVRRMCK